MPASNDAMPAGDFRDWADIEAWARGIAADLQDGSTPPGQQSGRIQSSAE